VKLGTIRPPISRIRKRMQAKPARMPISAAPRVIASMWKVALAAANSPTGTITARLRQFRPATISTTLIAVTASRKDRSSAITAQAGRASTPATASRASSHSPLSATSGRPRLGIRPVQFGIAVKRNPARTAGT